ncbi:MAG: tyrosine-type recombinase/integrase [Streptosporangiaceae bacterium]
MAGSRQPVPPRFAGVYDRYARALAEAGQLDAASTGRAYTSRIRSYLAWLDQAGRDGPDPLADHAGRDGAVRDYLACLTTVRGLAATTVNAHLSALDHFYEHLGLGAARMERGELPPREPRTLSPAEQARFLAAAGARERARDRAIARLLLDAGLSAAELAALDVGDLPLSDGEGRVIVRDGTGGISREIPLRDPAGRTVLAEWITRRATWPGAAGPALFLSRLGRRMSDRAVVHLVDGLAAAAGLAGEDGQAGVSVQTLRYTFGANRLRDGSDIVTVAVLMGYRRLDVVYLLSRSVAT